MWKNHLRISELPWLRDHQIHDNVVFPASGMICAAVEAARQIGKADTSQKIKGFELRDVRITRPLVFQELEKGIETLLHLKRRKLGMGSDTGAWHEFTFYSCQEGEAYVEHACGLIEIQYARPASEVDNGKEHVEEILTYQEKWNSQRAICMDVVTSPTHYEFWKSRGLCFGKLNILLE